MTQNFMRGNLRLSNNHERREEFAASGSRALGGRDKTAANKKLCLLTEEMVEVMKENFDKLDRFEDLVVPRAELVEAIRKDVRAKNFMNKGVVFLPKVNKQISMSKVLHQIEQEEFIRADKLDAGDSNFVSSKKYISWKNFMDYFLNYTKNQAPTELDLKKDTGDDQDILDIPKSLKEKMKSMFNELKDEDGFVKSFDYLNKLKAEPMIVNNLEAQIRSRARNGDIPSEKLRETLSRIEQQIDDYTDWEEFLQYFTRRGVPLAVELSKKIPSLTSNVAPLIPAKEIGSLAAGAEKVASALSNISNIPNLNQVQNISIKPPARMPWVAGAQGAPDTPSHEHAPQHGTKPGSVSLSQIPQLNATALGPYPGGKTVDFVVGDQLDHTKLQEYARAGQSVDLLAETRRDFPYYDNFLQNGSNPTQPQLAQNPNNTSFLPHTQFDQGSRFNHTGFQGDEQQGLPPGFLEAQNGNTGPAGMGSGTNFYPESYIPRPMSAGGQEYRQQEDDPYIIDDYVVYGDDGKTHKITVPSGLKFEALEERRSKSLKHKKFQEYISQKRHEEEEALKFQFRAKSIPDAVKQPLYSKIMAVSC